MFAFLFSKIGAYLVGAVVVAALVGGGYWYVKHLQGEVAGLKDKVAGLELRAEIVEKAQAKTDEFMKKKTTVQRKATSEKAEIDQTVQAGDNAHLRELFVNHGLLQPKSSGPPASRPAGRAGNPPSRPTNIQPIIGR